MKRRWLAMKVLFALAMSSVGAGCTHSVHQYTVGDYPRAGITATSAQVISTEGAIKSWFYASDTAFADEARRQLLAQCPNGEIYGIHARHSTSHGFLSYTNRLVLKAYCVRR